MRPDPHYQDRERRHTALTHLIEHFAQRLSEDAQDGTDFDLAVLDALESLQTEWGLRPSRQRSTGRLIRYTLVVEPRHCAGCCQEKHLDTLRRDFPVGQVNSQIGRVLDLQIEEWSPDHDEVRSRK